MTDAISALISELTQAPDSCWFSRHTTDNTGGLPQPAGGSTSTVGGGPSRHVGSRQESMDSGLAEVDRLLQLDTQDMKVAKAVVIS